MFYIKEENVQALNDINSLLGEIYTKGQDSVLIVNARTKIFEILNQIYENSISDRVKINVDMQEENNSLKKE